MKNTLFKILILSCALSSCTKQHQPNDVIATYPIKYVWYLGGQSNYVVSYVGHNNVLVNVSSCSTISTPALYSTSEKVVYDAKTVKEIRAEQTRYGDLIIHLTLDFPIQGGHTSGKSSTHVNKLYESP